MTRVQAELWPVDRAWEAHTIAIQHTGATFAPRLMPGSAWTRVQAEVFNPNNIHKEPLCLPTHAYTRKNVLTTCRGKRTI